MQIKKKVLILGGSSDIGISVINEYLLNDYLVFAHYNSNIKNLYIIFSEIELIITFWYIIRHLF